jgi:hypothetical protein
MMILNATEFVAIQRMFRAEERRLMRSQKMLLSAGVSSREMGRLLEPLTTKIRKLEDSLATFEAIQKRPLE